MGKGPLDGLIIQYEMEQKNHEVGIARTHSILLNVTHSLNTEIYKRIHYDIATIIKLIERTHSI